MIVLCLCRKISALPLIVSVLIKLILYTPNLNGSVNYFLITCVGGNHLESLKFTGKLFPIDDGVRCYIQNFFDYIFAGFGSELHIVLNIILDLYVYRKKSPKHRVINAL
jgi:hypothetical protein